MDIEFNSRINELLNGKIHNEAVVEMLDTDGVIVINNKRQFELPENFDTVIGYEGDVNSQIIRFAYPESWEGHDLTACQHRLRWYHSGNNQSGYVDLKQIDKTLVWEIEPEIFACAGTIEISITFYDVKKFEDVEKVVFSWNTAPFSQLSIAATQTNFDKEEFTRENTLTINEELRNIVAPKGYNYVVGNYGDIGVSRLYFQSDLKIAGMDLSETSNKIYIKYNIGEEIFCQEIKYRKQVFIDGATIQFYWDVPEALTAGNEYVENFTIEIYIESSNKKWHTNSFGTFKIGKSFSVNNVNPLPDGEDGENVLYIIQPSSNPDLTEKYISGIVLSRDYFNNEKPVEIRKNEMVHVYDEDGNYIGTKIGVENFQSTTDAPYLRSRIPITDLVQGDPNLTVHIECDFD